VDLLDERTQTVLCPIKPLDKSANATGQRRRLNPTSRDLSPLAPKGLPALMTQLLADYAATGVPPAYLPSTQEAHS
jgi:putative transposase